MKGGMVGFYKIKKQGVKSGLLFYLDQVSVAEVGFILFLKKGFIFSSHGNSHRALKL